MIKLKDILKERFGENTVIDRLFSGELNYNELSPDQNTSVYYEGWFLLNELKLNLSNSYKNVQKNSDAYGIYYSFKDSNDKLHYTRIAKDGFVKIGPATEKGIVFTKKTDSIGDNRVLDTHISNILKYVHEYKPEKLYFTIETDDGHEEARKRLFIGIAGKKYFDIRDIKIEDNGDTVILHLKYDEEGV